MKIVSIGFLIVGSLLLIMVIFVDNESNKQVNANSPVNEDMYQQTEDSSDNPEIQFINDVSNELKQQGYKSTGLIFSENYKSKTRFIVSMSSKEYKDEKTEENIKQVFDKTAKSYELKPFTIDIQTQ